MRKRHLLKVLSILIIFLALIFIWSEAQAITPTVAKLHVPFITNQGQTAEQVKFYAKTIGGTVFITENGEIVYSLYKVGEDNIAKGLALKEELYGAVVKDIKGEGKSITKVSYFVGKDPSKWKSNIPTYELVSLGEVYRNIELRLKAYGNNVEKIFSIRPGAKPEDIKVRLKGAKGLKINESGGLEVETELGTVKFTKPVAYQVKTVVSQQSAISSHAQNRSGILPDRGKQFVDVAYVVEGNEYRFKVGDYDRTKELVIDPLLASTYLGGSFDDYANAMAIDSDGNIYVTGATLSSDFPSKSNAYDHTYNASFDVFVSKFNGDLTTLIASTFLGGISSESANAIAINSSGKVYVAGKTLSTDFPTTQDAFDRNLSFNDAFISKFDENLTTLLGSTFLGGSGSESATSILIGSNGNVYVSGETSSANFPVTTGVYDVFYNGSYDVFISKLNGSLTSLLASTYLGGSSNDNAYSMASDANGNIYVVGSTFSGNYPTTSNAYDISYNGLSDAFVSKLNGNLTTLLASTYLGGGGNDTAYSIALGTNGNIYVAGDTFSVNFPTTLGVFDTSYNSSSDAFVSKFNGNLTTLIASTFLGSLANDSARSIALDLCGNVYVTGYTGSSAFPTKNADYPVYNGGFTDAFVTTLKGDLTSPLLYSTFLGGSGNDAFNTGSCFDKCFFADIAIDSRRNVYVAGETDSSDFPTTSGAFNEDRNGGMDVFVSKFSISLPVPQYTITVNKAGTGSGTVTSDPAGIDCGSVCSDTFKACTQVTLTATADADAGYTFTGWSGACTGGASTCTLAMNTNKTVKATFNPCTYSISPTSKTFFASGGTGSLNVATQSECTWNAVSSVDWITITSGSSGTGNGTVKYTVAANTLTTSRTGTVDIQGQTFTVTQNGAIIVTAPNGGEVIASGLSSYTISWNAPGEAVAFDLELSTDNGTTWNFIEKKVSSISCPCSYSWTVPKPLGNKRKCLVKITGYDDAAGTKVGSDRSDSTFTIEVIKLDTPSDTGISLTSGDPSYTISWTTNGTKKTPVAKTKLFVTKDGVNWEPIITLTGNPGSYPWSVPTVSKTRTHCKVKVELRDASGNILGTDASDNPFTINPAP
jgi:hypothetical protein